jgi:ATP-dependent helicase HrpB
MTNLPIYEVLNQVKNKLQNKNTLILEAPPGAGKSTIIPISFLDETWMQNKKIIMLEPRRVAARAVASRMAKLLGEEVGESVGYQVKMDSCYTKDTKLLVVTEAILVRKLQNNQTLDDVAMVIFDEFHERSIHSDLSLALSLQVQEFLRDDLKILIMSATLNSNEILELLGSVDVVTSNTNMYDVEEIYLDINTRQPDIGSLNQLLLKTIMKSLKEDDGDILVFLPGIKEIKNLHNLLLNSNIDRDIDILPLHSSLSKNEQDLALSKSQQRKVILSTNISQTSLTIEGVQVVIDSGYEKLSRFNHSNSMDHLELKFISKDSATQRAGRAGRVANGKCYRLWHQDKILQQSTKPEILRADITSLVLELGLWGVDEFNELKWLDIPNEKSVENTKEILKELEMLDSKYKITQVGKDAISFGVHPRFAYMILKANDIGYGYEACLLASLLTERDIFKSDSNDSDIFSRFIHLYEKDINNRYINIYRAKEVLKQAELFYKKLKSIKKITKNTNEIDKEMLAVLLLFAYPDRLARQRKNNDQGYKLSNAKGAVLNIDDSLFNREFLVVASLNAKEKNSHINLALAISLHTIEKYFSSHITDKESISYNKELKKFDIKESRYFLELQLDSKLSTSKKHDYKKLILNLIKQEGLGLLSWDKKALSLKNRVNFLNHHTDFRDFSDEALLKSLDIWLEPYLDGVKTIKELESLDTFTMLLSLLEWEEQQLLDAISPKSIKVPSGSNISIDYTDVLKPSIQVKIQEVFGLKKTPKLLQDKLPLQMHLLSPAMRPIQITYDLESFWENSYQEVRKELRGKYKKHYWPENPYEAIATNKTKKQMLKE